MTAQELFNTPLYNDANLVSYWRFEGNSNDSKGTNNGTDTAITYSSTGGLFGQYSSYNGTTSKIDVGGGSLSFSSNISVVAWMYKTSSGSTYQGVVDKGRDGFGGWSLCVDETAGKPAFHAHIAGANKIATSSTTYPTNSWFHVAGVYDGSNVIIYLNGSSVGSVAASGALGTNALNVILGDTNDSLFYGGRLDDVAIFSRDLTATEVSNLYNGFPVATGGTFPLLGV